MLALHGWRRDHRDFSLVLGPGAEAALSGSEARSGADAPLPDDAVPSIALDLPGFGATPPPDAAWGSVEYAESIAVLLPEMESPVIVVGHSFGGRVAAELAWRHPAEVAGVVLTGAPLFPASPGSKPRKPPLSLRVARRLARSGIVPETRLEEIKRRHGSADYRAATGVMRDVLVKAISEERNEAYTEALRATTCPVELVWGALDTAAPPHVAERIAAELAGPVTLSVFEGVGHLTPDAIPGQLRAAIDRLLSGVAS